MNQRIMSIRERKDREKLGWEETELEVKATLIKQDDAFCEAMRKAIAHGLEMQVWVK
jgi:hypothetical protein